MTTSRIERKLGRRILAVIEEMYATPHDNPKRFAILQHNLERLVTQYKEATGRDTLSPIDTYGYETK